MSSSVKYATTLLLLVELESVSKDCGVDPSPYHSMLRNRNVVLWRMPAELIIGTVEPPLDVERHEMSKTVDVINAALSVYKMYATFEAVKSPSRCD